MKYVNRILVASAVAAAMVGSVLSADAQVRGRGIESRANDGPLEHEARGVAPQSPIGTGLGSANLWAVVNADGTVDRSDGGDVPGTFKLSTGNYEVAFKRAVHVCAFSAVVGMPAASATSGMADVATRAGNNKAVFVETRDVTGALADRPFHLVVNC